LEASYCLRDAQGMKLAMVLVRINKQSPDIDGGVHVKTPATCGVGGWPTPPAACGVGGWPTPPSASGDRHGSEVRHEAVDVSAAVELSWVSMIDSPLSAIADIE
jgi:hypothetical protein